MLIGPGEGTHYHWNDAKIYTKCKSFLEESMFHNKEVFTEMDIWKMVAILHPTKATMKSKKKDRINKPTC